MGREEAEALLIRNLLGDGQFWGLKFRVGPRAQTGTERCRPQKAESVLVQLIRPKQGNPKGCGEKLGYKLGGPANTPSPQGRTCPAPTQAGQRALQRRRSP